MTRAPRRLLKSLAATLAKRRFRLPPELRHANELTEALECIDRRWPESFVLAEDPESPVFLFAAGWRSGSTLLQRLVISSGEVFIWGEPLGNAAVISRIGQSLATISRGWPPDRFFDTAGGMGA